jgi:hypothetical protein
MKKFLIVSMVCLSWLTYAGEVSVEGGYLPSTREVDYSQEYASENYFKDVLYLTMNVEFSILKGGFIGGSTSTYMVPTKQFNFHPMYTSYTFSTGWRYKDVTIGYQHTCSHSVAALGYIVDPMMDVDSSVDRVYIKIVKSF